MTASDGKEQESYIGATGMGIIPHDPRRDDAVMALRLGTQEAPRLIFEWLDKREASVAAANKSVAAIGLTMDLASIYEDAELFSRAADAYRAAREAAWHEHMDGVIRLLDQKLERMQTFGLTAPASL